jgi:hypothetical protein
MSIDSALRSLSETPSKSVHVTRNVLMNLKCLRSVRVSNINNYTSEIDRIAARLRNAHPSPIFSRALFRATSETFVAWCAR